MFSSSVKRLVNPAAALQRAFLVAILFGALGHVGGLARAGTISTTANQLLGGLTKYDLNDYENLYDSTGNIVTSGSGAALIGDSLQGVFIVNAVTNQTGNVNYSPQNGGVQITGIFDELITGVDPAGNFILAPDTTTGTSGAANGKPVSGQQFQAQFGAGAMIAVFQNTTAAMNPNQNAYGLQGLTTAQGFALAQSGSEWASFGAKGNWGQPGGYYWSVPPTASLVAVTSFAASLGFIQNNTGLNASQFVPLNQAAPGGFAPDPTLFGLANAFVVQGTLNPTSQQLGGTNYEEYSTDPVQVNFVPVPEPSSIALIGALFGVLALLHCRKRQSDPQ